MQRVLGGLAAAVFVLAGMWARGEAHDESFTKEGLFKADVLKLKDTQLVAHPDVPLDPAKNLLWCGTLQLAWNEATKLVGEPLHFTTPSPTADLLNRMDFKRGDLDPGSYVALADFERNQVEQKIREALEEVFHGAASPELIPPVPAHPGPYDFVAYAYLYKNLEFAKPFANDQHLFFEGKAVKSFGFNSDNNLPAGTREQVSIDDYRSPDDFVIELKTKAAGDQLILAKVAPGATLQATMASVLARAAKAGIKMGVTPQDRLAVPKLNFDLRRDFPELEGLKYVPGANSRIKEPLVISKAEQLVRFQLNEKGAVLKSEAVMVMRAMVAMAGHDMIFDKPFLILMKQVEAKEPYFALWVGNGTLLVAEKGRVGQD